MVGQATEATACENKISLRNIASNIYRTVRPVLPTISGYYNSVEVPNKHRVGDYILTSESPVKQDYEAELIRGLEEVVELGDNVTVIGGGCGVSAVRGSRLAGDQGSVTVFEAGEEQVKQVRETLKVNDCSSFKLVQGLFYVEKNIYGSSSKAQYLEADAIPECDVLELDCEGAEIPILQDLDFKPRNIVVESHEGFEAPKDKVVSILGDQGYEILWTAVDDEEAGTDIIVAEYRGDGL